MIDCMGQIDEIRKEFLVGGETGTEGRGKKAMEICGKRGQGGRGNNRGREGQTSRRIRRYEDGGWK